MTVSKLSPQKQNKLAFMLIIAGVILLLFVAWAWWHFVRSDAERTFYGALENSLKTKNVTRQIKQADPGQTLEQTVSLSLAPDHLVQGQTTISGEEPRTIVQTETIGTPRADYVRYTEIDTDQTNDSGEAMDFGEVLNIWSKTDAPDSSQTTGELYGESVLGLVPVGNLPAAQRKVLMDYIKDNRVYQFDKSSVKKETKNGRPVYAYTLTVPAEGWVGMLKIFAAAIGLTQLDAVEPSAYKDAQPIELEMTIDVWSRLISGISYGQERREQFSSYGVLREITLPDDSISVDELQKRLQNLE